MQAIEYPDYPCVAMESPNHRHTISAATKEGVPQHDIRKPTIVFYPVSAFDDLTHVDFCREYKGFAVLGYAHLEQIAAKAPYKAPEVAKMKQKLDKLIRPPELARAERAAVAGKEESEGADVKAGRGKA